MVWLDHGSFRARSLLCTSGDDGAFDVFGVEDDAHDQHRPAAADDAEDHAGDHGGNFYDFAHFQRLGGVHSDQQRGGHRAAVVSESHAPCASADSGENHAWEKVLEYCEFLVDADNCSVSFMSSEIIRDGKLDRAATAEALRQFLDAVVRASGLELRVDVRAVAAGAGIEGDAEVLADLDGADKGFLLERNAEVLKAMEHLVFKALRLEPP